MKTFSTVDGASVRLKQGGVNPCLSMSSVVEKAKAEILKVEIVEIPRAAGTRFWP